MTEQQHAGMLLKAVELAEPQVYHTCGRVKDNDDLADHSKCDQCARCQVRMALLSSSIFRLWVEQGKPDDDGTFGEE